MNTHILQENAKQILSKTILAADESTTTIKKRFVTIGIESTPEVNRQYRNVLFTTPGIEQFVSGVILFDETIRQSSNNGIQFPVLLKSKHIIPGIKVDLGTANVNDSSVDTYTKGLDNLSTRLQDYLPFQPQFAKWRAVYTINATSPSQEIIQRNARDLAQYAFLCQQVEVVPIVEPEVLMDGDHSLEKNKEVSLTVLTAVFSELQKTGVALEGIILKPNMIIPGKNNPAQASVEQVAQATLDVLKQVVPPEVPGIAFLSGGQSPDIATQHLNQINKIKTQSPTEYPWRITASFGRALQGETIEAWGGKSENVTKAQHVFLDRAEKVYEASLGAL